MAANRDERGRFLRKGAEGGTTTFAGGAFKIEENAEGWMKLRDALDALRAGDAYVKAGVIGDPAREAHDTEGGPLTTARLAAIHEFGTDTIPARPFILGTFDLNRKKYVDLLRTTVIPAIYAGRVSVRKGLEVVGHMMASDMRNRIVEGAGIPPPLAESTIQAKIRKGAWNKRAGMKRGEEGPPMAPRALIDTGRMRNAITHEVAFEGDE